MTVLLLWGVRLLLLVLLVRFVASFFVGARAGASARSSRRAPRRRQGVALVRDPVCGTYVEPTHALTVHVGSTTHYFCSESCRRAFGKGDE